MVSVEFRWGFLVSLLFLSQGFKGLWPCACIARVHSGGEELTQGRYWAKGLPSVRGPCPNPTLLLGPSAKKLMTFTMKATLHEQHDPTPDPLIPMMNLGY